MQYYHITLTALVRKIFILIKFIKLIVPVAAKCQWQNWNNFSRTRFAVAGTMDEVSTRSDLSRCLSWFAITCFSLV